MGKRLVILLVIAIAGFLATTAYAEPKMVIVLDPLNPGSIICYRVSNITPGNAMVGVNPCDMVGGTIPIVGNQINIRDQHGSLYNQTPQPHPLVSGITNPQGGTIVWSNPCVTYRIGGQTYTVCN